MTVFTGDLKITLLDDGTYDIVFANGQPDMTNGFETNDILAIFGEDWWGNDIVDNESEKMQSTFPEVIRRNVVTDKTKNDGTKAIEKALSFKLTEQMVKSITVTSEIINAFTIGWLVEQIAITDETLKYFINWEKGELTAKFVNN